MAVIAIDLDGTLLRPDKTVSEFTRATLARVRAAGHVLVFATARPVAATREVLPADCGDDWLVCYNGARVVRGPRMLLERLIPGDDVLGFVQRLRERAPATAWGVVIGDELHACGSFEEHFPKNCYVELTRDLAGLGGSPKILVDVTPEAVPDELRSLLPASCDDVVTDQGRLWQIVPAGVDKATGVEAVLKQVGAGFGEVVCFGDDYNDLPLFRRCGLPVAMPHAVPELKALARELARSHAEDGVARFLDAWLSAPAPGGGWPAARRLPAGRRRD